MMTVIVQVIVNSTIRMVVPVPIPWTDDTSVEENNFGKRWTKKLKE